MHEILTTIRENRQISPTFYLMTFDWDVAWGIPKPGSFLEARVSPSTTPLLRRPFGFSHYDAEAGTASMIYEKRGQGTALLAEKQVGQTISMIAPLGTTFGVTGTPQSVITVGGGVGLGPILFAAQEAHNAQIPYRFIIGFRNAQAIPERELFACLNPQICTDDGSEGFHGNVVSYLQQESQTAIAEHTLWACGPVPMLRACHNFAQAAGLTCEVSMEEMMACGVGACAGCVVETTEGALSRVCKEGPVYESGVLAWN